MDSSKNKMTGYKKVINWAKNRYSLEKDVDVWLVFILFAITGSSSVRIGDPLLNYFGFVGGHETFTAEWWKFVGVRVPFIFVFYQFLFVGYGFLIGLLRKPVWTFTWWFERKMLSRFGLKFK